MTLAGDVRRGHPRLVLPEMRELRRADHVADRPYARGGAEALVDDHPAPVVEAHTELLEPELSGVRPASHGDEQALRLDARPVREPDPDTCAGRLDALSVGRQPDVDAFGGEDLADQLACVDVHTPEQPVTVLDNGHPRAHAREELRELGTDGATAEDGEARG